MKAYEVQEATSDYSGVVRTERERPVPADDEALVRIRACSLNYRDLAIASSELFYPQTDLPVVPLSDGAGEVVAVGDDVRRLSEGDRVATPFAPDWVEGEATPRRSAARRAATSTARWRSTPPSPPRASRSSRSTSPSSRARPCRVPVSPAWRALAEDGDLGAGESVLTLGTGGVSTFALQFAEMHGASTVVTSSDEKLERARELGADETINYETTPEWGEAVRERIGGVDHVVEVGGPGTLDQSLQAAAFNGHVHLIGVLAGQGDQVDPTPALGKALKIEGVMGVGSRAMFDRMLRAMAVEEMEPEIDRTFGFDEVQEAYQYVEDGEHQGKVVVTADA